MPGNSESRFPDPDAAALRQARERGAAPVAAGRSPAPDAPKQPSGVRETAPVRGVSVRGGRKGARSFVLSKPKKKEEARAGRKAPDPRGKGKSLDARA